MVPPMADEFYEKYKHLSHQELYRMLRSGSVRQADSVGDTWGSVAATLSGMADSLRQDMERLLAGLSGNVSEDVLEGVGALAKRAKLLAEEATGMRTGLTAMVQALAAAQSQAEAPQEIPAATTAVSSVLGAEVGHVPTPEQLAQARERMVWLVARLSAQYGIAEHANWPTLAALPVAIIGGAQLIHLGHGRDDGHHHRRHGTRLLGAGDLVRHRLSPSHLPPLLSSGHTATSPFGLGLGYTSAEGAGVLRGATTTPRAPSVHIVSGGAPAVPLPTPDAPAAAAAAPAGGAAAPPPPVGLGGAGMAQSGSVIGGATAPGMGGPSGLMGGQGMTGEVTWQSADNVEWMDPDDAAPPVIGG